ncbi:hypothetical protein RF11_09345 [Thelohanellus kitauei]|uniref:UBC core domain-containing protein n=1 Tax=Thelohanellus kitauei TaxID=669202 RepID=A0A0C2IXV9_THEKT|nr:hypothetical protein RF11_09345 [Thelohanellus kitauei]
MASNQKMNIAYSRVHKEIQDIKKTTVETINDDLSEIHGSFEGPSGTPYQGGRYRILIKIPPTYPFFPPEAKFNLNKLSGLLQKFGTQTAAAMSIRTILMSIQVLMCSPVPDDPQDAVVASQTVEPKVCKWFDKIYLSGPSYGAEDADFDQKVGKLTMYGVEDVSHMLN